MSEFSSASWCLMGAGVAFVGTVFCVANGSRRMVRSSSSRWDKFWIAMAIICGLLTLGLFLTGGVLKAVSDAEVPAKTSKSTATVDPTYQVGVCVNANSLEYRISLRWQTDRHKNLPDIMGMTWNSFYLYRFGERYCGVIGPLEHNRVTEVIVTEPSRLTPWVITRFELRHLYKTEYRPSFPAPEVSVTRIYQKFDDGYYHFRVVAASDLSDEIPTVDITPVADPATLLPVKDPPPASP